MPQRNLVAVPQQRLVILDTIHRAGLLLLVCDRELNIALYFLAATFRVVLMRVTKIATTDQLQHCSAAWNCLTRGVPFRGWEWLSTWWEHYGAGRELFVLAVHDECGTLTGLLPLFRERSAARGRVLQWLGSGEVCTDYVTLLSTNEHQDLVAEAIASWLIDACSREASDADRWDLLELDGILNSDSAIAKLVLRLSEAGCGVHRRHGPGCWQLPLPESWEQVYERLSKNRRKAFRRLQRDAIDSGRLVFKTAHTDDEFRIGMKLLVELHQKRRASLGDPGCFASQRFSAFIHSVSRQLRSVGALELSWIELDEVPVGIEFCLLGANTTYGYQGGIDPDAIKESPGHLMMMALIRHSIANSRTTYDLLRGDEPYKADWNAVPQATVKLRVSANRTTAQLRQSAWLAGAAVKRLVKSGLTRVAVNRESTA